MSHLTMQALCYIYNKYFKQYGLTSIVFYAPIWYYEDNWVAIQRVVLSMLNGNPLYGLFSGWTLPCQQYPTCEKHHSSTMAPTCYMSMAILVMYWGLILVLGLVKFVEHY